MTENKENLDCNAKEALEAGVGPKIARFTLAALGSIPIIGGLFGASAGAWTEAEQERFNKIFSSWLKLICPQ